MFVFALILLVRDRRALVGAVTAFTVAHSLSLAAAALGWIVVPAPPVEAVVALSIMFLAAELVRPEGAAEPDACDFRGSWPSPSGCCTGSGSRGRCSTSGCRRGRCRWRSSPSTSGWRRGSSCSSRWCWWWGRCSGGSIRWLVGSVTRPGGRGLGVASYLMGGIAAVWFVGRVAAF